MLHLAGIAQPPVEQVNFAGADPVFPTRYRIAAAGAAALAAVGVAATRLWSMGTGGPPQRLSIDLRAAAASLRSSRYLRVNGAPPPEAWDPLSGFYPVADGRAISIHCNFAAHRQAAMRVLGSPADRAAAEAASRRWNGTELEDAIHAAGGCAGFARTAEEWAMHPQAQAVATQPLIEIQRIGGKNGDRPHFPKMGSVPIFSPRPLAGIRVLDLTRVLAGPTCARTLAEHGADVLKIGAAHIPDMPSTEIDTGIGKLSAHLDLRTREGSAALRSLLADADVFSQSYRPGALAARGFSPQEAAAIRPGIVYVSLSAWGDTGPWRARRGFDSIVQSVSGIAIEQGGAVAKPRYVPVSAIDYVSGYLMAFGAMVALERRCEEGGSWLVRVSLARTGRWITDLGMLEREVIANVPAELPQQEIDRLTTEIDAPIGRVRHLRPVLAMSATAPALARPPVASGASRAEWP